MSAAPEIIPATGSFKSDIRAPHLDFPFCFVFTPSLTRHKNCFSLVNVGYGGGTTYKIATPSLAQTTTSSLPSCPSPPHMETAPPFHCPAVAHPLAPVPTWHRSRFLSISSANRLISSMEGDAAEVSQITVPSGSTPLADTRLVMERSRRRQAKKTTRKQCRFIVRVVCLVMLREREWGAGNGERSGRDGNLVDLSIFIYTPYLPTALSA